MVQVRTKLAREKPCPGCGYDLRAAAVGGRCPECGAEVAAGVVASRIPWVHRRQTGRIRAYFKTVWMVLRRPGVLAKEVERPVVLRDARRFYWVSVWLAVAIAFPLLVAAFMMGREHGEFTLDDNAFWAWPVFVVGDRWWGFSVLAMALWLTIRLFMTCFRWLLVMGMESGVRRGRLWRVGLYASAAAPVEAGLIGAMALAAIGLKALLGESGVTGYWPMLGLLALLAAVAYYVPAMTLIGRSGRWKFLRRAVVAVVLPVMAGATLVGLIVALMWTVGYVMMAIRSMTL